MNTFYRLRSENSNIPLDFFHKVNFSLSKYKFKREIPKQRKTQLESCRLLNIFLSKKKLLFRSDHRIESNSRFEDRIIKVQSLSELTLRYMRLNFYGAITEGGFRACKSDITIGWMEIVSCFEIFLQFRLKQACNKELADGFCFEPSSYLSSSISCRSANVRKIESKTSFSSGPQTVTCRILVTKMKTKEIKDLTTAMEATDYTRLVLPYVTFVL